MTEAEWLACEYLIPMLIFLRGDVSEEQRTSQKPHIISGQGDLFGGLGPYMRAEQCRQIILRCTNRLHEVPLDEPSRLALAVYRRYVLERAPREEFFQACLRIQDVVMTGGKSVVSHLAEGFWTDDPVGVAHAANDVAWTIANVKAEESVAVTCADATEDDWFAWGFFGGPPDPLWQATRAAEERFQVGLLREIVGNPFRDGGPAVSPEGAA